MNKIYSIDKIYNILWQIYEEKLWPNCINFDNILIVDRYSILSVKINIINIIN